MVYVLLTWVFSPTQGEGTPDLLTGFCESEGIKVEMVNCCNGVLVYWVSNGALLEGGEQGIICKWPSQNTAFGLDGPDLLDEFLSIRVEHPDITQLSDESKLAGAPHGLAAQAIFDFLPNLMEGQVFLDDVEENIVDVVFSCGINGTLGGIHQGIIKGMATSWVTCIVCSFKVLYGVWHRLEEGLDVCTPAMIVLGGQLGHWFEELCQSTKVVSVTNIIIVRVRA
ncbi:hypothetical protein NDA17_006679 [Ustilago hordei]|nr:hypothetical protein NDA17_006679 [Ustilago hordei]